MLVPCLPLAWGEKYCTPSVAHFILFRGFQPAGPLPIAKLPNLPAPLVLIGVGSELSHPLRVCQPMQRPPVRERAVLGLYSLAGATAGAALALRKAGASGAAAVALWLATTAALAHSFIAAVVTPSLLLSAGLRVSAPPPPPRPHLLPNTLLSELTRRQPPPPAVSRMRALWQQDTGRRPSPRGGAGSRQ